MAAKRDSFPPIADNHISNEKLAPWYNAVYRQLSSISHYDRFAVEMVTLLPFKDDQVVLGFQPYWPGLLILYTTFLDIIQCHEVTTVCFQTDASIQFESLFLEWGALAAKL